MTIPGLGDLSPPHRHVPVGRYLTVAVVVALLGVGGYVGYRGLSGGSTDKAGATPKLKICPKRSPNPLFAAPHQVHLSVFNASLRTGLAAEVQSALADRGFHISQIGNAMQVGHNVATIRYSADELRGSRTLAAQIPGRPTLKQVPGTQRLELDIGVRFSALRSTHAVKSAERAALAAAPTPSPSSTATCRPRQ